ncbi:MAG: xanthine dehydrogenase family protein molybdopterin-binding subunit, partial [Acidimicrobiia bacterium]
ERAVDAIAVAAGLDPAEIRRRNLILPHQLPYRTAAGALYDSGDYRAALDLALSLVDVEGVRAQQLARRKEGRDPIGLGIGAFVERAGGAIDSGEYGRVEVGPDGTVVVRTGSTSAGQGHETVWEQVVSEALTVAPEAVRVVAGDTAEVPNGVGSFASRSAQVGASAAWRTAVEVGEQARRLCAEMLEADPADLILEGGRFRVSGVPGTEITLAEVAARAAELGEPLAAEEMFAPGAQTFPYGVHLAVVEIELETGSVRLRSLVAVDDCGRVLNPMVVEGQLHGSLMQGIGQALLEEFRYDEHGQPLTATLMDYLIPSAVQEMPLRTGRLVHPAPSNPLGVKGTGEAGCIGMPAAILNAVYDALAPYGVTNLRFPLSPGRVWEAIRRGREKSDG